MSSSHVSSWKPIAAIAAIALAALIVFSGDGGGHHADASKQARFVGASIQRTK